MFSISTMKRMLMSSATYEMLGRLALENVVG